MNQKHYHNEYYIVQNTGFTFGRFWLNDSEFPSLIGAEQKLMENKKKLPSMKHRIVFRMERITETVYE